jgi:hypothetical protein
MASETTIVVPAVTGVTVAVISDLLCLSVSRSFTSLTRFESKSVCFDSGVSPESEQETRPDDQATDTQTDRGRPRADRGTGDSRGRHGARSPATVR